MFTEYKAFYYVRNIIKNRQSPLSNILEFPKDLQKLKFPLDLNLQRVFYKTTVSSILKSIFH